MKLLNLALAIEMTLNARRAPQLAPPGLRADAADNAHE